MEYYLNEPPEIIKENLCAISERITESLLKKTQGIVSFKETYGGIPGKTLGKIPKKMSEKSQKKTPR